MALLKTQKLDSGVTVDYWRITYEERYYEVRGLTIDVVLFPYASGDAYGDGCAPAGARHRFRILPEMLANSDPSRADIYGALKANDPFFAEASDDLKARKPEYVPPAPDPAPQKTFIGQDAPSEQTIRFNEQ